MWTNKYLIPMENKLSEVYVAWEKDTWSSQSRDQLAPNGCLSWSADVYVSIKAFDPIVGQEGSGPFYNVISFQLSALLLPFISKWIGEHRVGVSSLSIVVFVYVEITTDFFSFQKVLKDWENSVD